MSDITWRKLEGLGPRTDQHDDIGFEDIVLFKLQDPDEEGEWFEYYLGDGEDYWDQKQEIRNAVEYAIVQRAK